MTDLELQELFRVLQAVTWLLAFIVTLALIGGSHWKDSKVFLKLNVAGWTTSTLMMFILTMNLKAHQLFPWGFKPWCAITPIFMCVAATSILWYCNSAMRELNTKNNRRASRLTNPPKTQAQGNSSPLVH